jgi:hypothetical protein
MDRGERINVESGTEAAAVARGSQIQGGLLKGPWEDFVGDTLGTFGSALQTPGLLTGNITVPVLGTRDAQLLIQQLGGGPVNQLGTVSGERLRGSFLYEVRPNSMAPRDPLEDQRRAVANLEVAAKFGGNAVKMPQLLMDYWLAVDEDPGRVTMSPQEMQGADAVAAGMPKDEQGQKRNGQGGPIVPPQLLRSVR